MMVSTTSRRLACAWELILAVLEILARLEQQRRRHEHVGLVDHALALQQIGDVADAAARNVDDLVARRAGPALEALLADHEADAGDDRRPGTGT